ncbi:hypothetical protein GCM10011611_41210 [Aliidongia dinghuensis]|uniref:Uncharacterized protein n=1 Tax=Aliidongia dinghuensis TaxID=1867774 RepID=A0A8J3E4X6_9PROT|nr:hypothetical protein [Aliidongia dinghuensis]GGF30882.1 hypothetical protein GCM10011611_41210 [Aliidongia dinghuensis]
MYALIFALGFAAFTLGGLTDRVGEHEPWLEAATLVALGVGFVLGAIPRGWSIVPRAILPLPTFLVFLTILTDRKPVMPFYAAFAAAAFYALFITSYASFLSHRNRPDEQPVDEDHSQV